MQSVPKPSRRSELQNFLTSREDVARGHQKSQSQQKNAKKQADIKKSKGHDQKVYTWG